MQKRRVGKTGLDVSVIGLGTVKFGRNQGVKYPASFSLPTDNDIVSLLSIATDLGVNLLDTAPAYGTSEERLGKLLRNRHSWVISSKVGEEFIDGESRFDFSALSIVKSVERSLKRLQTDYLDIMLVHSNGDDCRIIEQDNVFAVLETLKKDGKIRAYGMSTKTVAGGLLTVDLADVAMVTYNLDETGDREVIAAAHCKQKGIFIKKALRSGHLQKPAADCMRFILAEPGVTSIITGTINPEHLRENIQAIL